MVNLDEFKYGGTNLTAFRLLDPERDEVKQVVQDWIFGELRYGRKLEPHEQTIKVNKQLFVAVFMILIDRKLFVYNLLEIYVLLCKPNWFFPKQLKHSHSVNIYWQNSVQKYKC